MRKFFKIFRKTRRRRILLRICEDCRSEEKIIEEILKEIEEEEKKKGGEKK